MALLVTPKLKAAMSSECQLSKRKGCFLQLLYQKRQGALLLEVVTASALLATLLVLVNQAIVRMHAQVDLADERIEAQVLLENMLEEFASGDWNSLSTAAIGQLKIPDFAASKLPEAALTGIVEAEAVPVEAKRITLQLSWMLGSGREAQPLRLSTWVYKRPEME